MPREIEDGVKSSNGSPARTAPLLASIRHDSPFYAKRKRDDGHPPQKITCSSVGNVELLEPWLSRWTMTAAIPKSTAILSQTKTTSEYVTTSMPLLGMALANFPLVLN